MKCNELGPFVPPLVTVALEKGSLVLSAFHAIFDELKHRANKKANHGLDGPRFITVGVEPKRGTSVKAGAYTLVKHKLMINQIFELRLAQLTQSIGVFVSYGSDFFKNRDFLGANFFDIK